MAAVVISGCGTTLQGGCLSGPAIYGGIRCDVKSIAQADDAGEVLLMLTDLPLSLVADTVILPWSIYNEIKQGGVKVKSIQEILDFPFPFGGGLPKKKKEKQKEKPSKGNEKKSSKKSSE